MNFRMKWPPWKHVSQPADTEAVDKARCEREISEQRLEEAQVAVIIPLRDMHKENHVGWMLERLIERRARERSQERGNGEPGSASD